jgi:hypothetical protein
LREEKAMTELTRRAVLAGAAAVSAAFTVPSISLAAAPPAGRQAPGWYRYKSAISRSRW